MIRILLSIAFLIGFVGSTWAQPGQLSNQRKKMIALDSLPVQLDSLTIIPESLRLSDQGGNPIPAADYLLFRNELFWAASYRPDSIAAEYRVIPYDLYKVAKHLDTTKIEYDEAGDYIGFDFSPYDAKDELVDFQGLDYNGSFARGISFGNNQNLVLNSSFNLQLAGNLGDDVEILAAISDNSIPLQPEGNTQQLQEFDRIFIQLKKNNASLTAGDYELARPNSYFMNYFKKLKGATAENTWEINDKARFSTKASVAISKGKFARNNLVMQEGNQGPYRLEGTDGERFIIIEAGTEKVFWDGQLLTRGLEEDYIIDYNRADIQFTNKWLVTKDIRVIVEFEYSVQNFTRSLLAVNSAYENDKMRLYLNIYSEQDAKNSGAALDLDSLQRTILSQVGDDLENAIDPGIDSLPEFNEFRVSYKQIDSSYLINGIPQTENILVYSTNPDSALYAASFLNVGSGNGNYILDTNTPANGRVYRWVAPDPSTGALRGNFIPGRKLIAPNQQALYTVGGEFKLNKKSSILTEVALSNNDQNRFSNVDDGNNTGIAFYSQYRNSQNLDREKNWLLDTQIGYEFLQENFKALNPYRNAEFTRDWNIGQQSKQRSQEHIGKAGFTLTRKNLGSLSYEFSGFLRGDLYTGTRHFSRLNFKRSGFAVDLQGNLTETDAIEERSTFFRPKAELSKTFKKLKNWKVGVYGEREKNDRYAKSADSLSLNSFYYDLYKVYLESPQNENFSFGFNYRQRYDYAPVDMDFLQNTVADEFNVNGNWRQGKSSTLRWNLSYRELSISDPKLTNLDPQETFLGRLEHSLTLFKGTIRSSTNYEIGSGQERKQEYQYLPVAPGEGVYTWIADLNGDSIPQINEIEEAVFQNDANIIRVSIFTDDFIRTNNVSLNQSLRLAPRAIWYQEKGIKKLLSRFSSQSTLRIIRKTREAPDVTAWNPFQLDVADTTLVSTSSSIRNTLFFNQGDPKYDLQIGQFNNQSKVILTTGFESRGNAEQFFRTRWNITKYLTGIFSITQGNRKNNSEFFNNRDYSIDFYRIEPEITVLPLKNLRGIFSYKFQESTNNLPDGGERAIIHDLSVETTYNQSSKSSFRTSFTYVNIDFTGEANSNLEFAMLDGLRNGQNFLWNVLFDRRLAKNIQLSLNYEGRKTGTNTIVHVGRAQVRATF
jgi:hypothetical protein